MWEISNGFQAIGFLRAFILGGVFCLLYDILRALRKTGFNSDFAVFWQDIIFFIIISPITFCVLLVTTNGEPRAYFLIGIIIGFTIIRLTISFIILKLFLKLIALYLLGFNKVKHILYSIFNLVFRIYCYFKVFFIKNLNKMIKCFKKLLKKSERM